VTLCHGVAVENNECDDNMACGTVSRNSVSFLVNFVAERMIAASQCSDVPVA
jgi:hypothetical protein